MRADRRQGKGKGKAVMPWWRRGDRRRGESGGRGKKNAHSLKIKKSDLISKFVYTFFSFFVSTKNEKGEERKGGKESEFGHLRYSHYLLGCIVSV